MGILDGAVPNFGLILNQVWYFLSNGGWILVVLTFAYLLYLVYMDEINGQFLNSQEWVFLSVKVPRENLVSTLAVEQIYSQLHALHTNITFAQKYIEGKLQLWYSLEIVSLGGKVSFIIRTPKKLKQLVEASFYSHYPQAEISETSDYLENLEFDPEKSDFDIFGTEYKLISDQTIPIKTYKDFEHSASENIIVDPLTPTFEALSKMEPHELFAVQILIQPVADSEWKPDGEKKAKELQGEKVPEKMTFLKLLLLPFDAFAKFSFKDAILPKPAKEEGAQQKTFMNLSDVDKERINLVLKKIGKPGYNLKMRHLYLAPKDKFDGSKKALMIGAVRTLGSAQTNSFKPDTKKTWTSVEYQLSPTLEEPYIKYLIKDKKKKFFKGFKNRSMGIGISPFIFNVEEIATIYHLPLTVNQEAPPSAVSTTETKKSQPPANLPIGE